jgi:hypothetical protein
MNPTINQKLCPKRSRVITVNTLRFRLVIEPKDSNRLRLKKSYDTISKEFANDNRNPEILEWNASRFCIIGVICGTFYRSGYLPSGGECMIPDTFLHSRPLALLVCFCAIAFTFFLSPWSGKTRSICRCGTADSISFSEALPRKSGIELGSMSVPPAGSGWVDDEHAILLMSFEFYG